MNETEYDRWAKMQIERERWAKQIQKMKFTRSNKNEGKDAKIKTERSI